MVESALAKKSSGETVAAAPETAGQTEAASNVTVSGPVAGFEKIQTEVKGNMDKAMKTAEEFVAFSQGNFEALVKSGQIWAAGVQDLSKTVAASAQAQFDEALALVKALAGVKSFKEALDLQTSLARASLDKAMAETGRLTDAGVKLAEQTWAPLTDRVNLAVEKFGRAA